MHFLNTSKVYQVSYSKNTLYTSIYYAVLIFTAKLGDQPQQYNPLAKLKFLTSLPAKTFLKFLTPLPQAGGGEVHALQGQLKLIPLI